MQAKIEGQEGIPTRIKYLRSLIHSAQRLAADLRPAWSAGLLGETLGRLLRALDELENDAVPRQGEKAVAEHDDSERRVRIQEEETGEAEIIP